MRTTVLLLMGVLLVPTFLCSQETGDYQKAGWMTTRMYGGNRSGYGPNWLIMDHGRGYDFVKDADGDYDLTGGWHDCGDHVKFGQTQFYSGYMLLLGYSAFPEGYDDYYSADYEGYHNANDFTWEGGKGKPNGIPDILDEVKYATDYFIKCTRDGSTFYSQVGNGNDDHKNWTTSVDMAQLSNSEGGEANGSRVIKKNPKDASMASFCGAALALMYRSYKHFDQEYAELCLEHALYAYEYAKSNQTNSGGGTITGRFYGPDNKWQDNYVCLCAELYWATGEEKYKTEALSYSSDVENHGWVLDFENNDDIAAYALAKLGDSNGKQVLAELAQSYIDKVNGNGCIKAGSNWGVLRYSASAAFVVALNQAFNNETTISPAVQGTMDYIMGYNSASQSFIVGFGNKSPRNPHHRNIFLNGGNIPGRNAQHGYMVGGSHNPSAFPDAIDNYQTSEGGIDYNSGLVGSLAYILSRIAPVDQSKFGISLCGQAELGPDKSLCGVGSIELNSQLSTQGRTFSWFKDGQEIQGTDASITVSEAGTYTIQADSAGCKTSDKVTITDEIPAVDLGADKILTSETVMLESGIEGEALTFTWAKDGHTIPNENQASYAASATGIYTVTVSGEGCASKVAEVSVILPPSFAFTSTEIIIDGIKDEPYTNGYPIETVVAGSNSSSSPAGKWSGLWDETNVYLFISVTDESLFNDSGDNWYEDDGVEIFFDGGNEKSTTYDNNDFQIGCIWGAEAIVEGGNNPNTISGTEQFISETENGYTIEIKIPWASLNSTPQIGKTIGFDACVNDDDDGNGRETKTAWFQSTDDGWQNPSVLGEITLVGEAQKESETQTISLEQGWNLISFYVVSDEMSTAAVFNNPAIKAVKTADKFWNPDYSDFLNTLLEVSYGEGYLVYAETAADISITGTIPTAEPIFTTNGNWKLIAAGSTEINTTDLTDFDVIKDNESIYLKGSNTNTLNILSPGRAYFAK